MKITIGGLAGTGKGDTSKSLAKEFGIPHMSAGNFFREFARKHNISVVTLDLLAESNPSIDWEVDERTREYGKTHESFVFEGRFPWYFIPDSFKIRLVCGFVTRIKRIARREGKSFEMVVQETQSREDAVRKRAKEFYGIEDFHAAEHFDCTIDTTELTQQQVVEEIKRKLSVHKNGR